MPFHPSLLTAVVWRVFALKTSLPESLSTPLLENAFFFRINPQTFRSKKQNHDKVLKMTLFCRSLLSQISICLPTLSKLPSLKKPKPKSFSNRSPWSLFFSIFLFLFSWILAMFCVFFLLVRLCPLLVCHVLGFIRCRWRCKGARWYDGGVRLMRLFGWWQCASGDRGGVTGFGWWG